jgi:aspartate racemase
MPCNSLQRVAAREARRAGIPFVDMIGATIDAARESGAARAILIATEATLAGGVYEGYGIEIVVPSDEIRGRAVGLIARAVAGPPPGGDELRDLVAGAAQPAAAVVLGCTDICGLLDPGDAARAGVVESLGCLAQRCADALRVSAPVS